MEMRKLIIPALLLLLVAELATAVAIVAAQPGGFDTVFGVFGPERRQELPAQTFTTNKGASLLVDNGNGKIEVIGTPGITEVTVKATKIARGFSDDALGKLKFEASQNGNQVVINAKQANDWAGWFSSRVDVHITVPDYMLTNLNSGNGEITVSGLTSSEARHQMHNSNGSIKLNGVKAAQLTLTNSNGSINLQTVQASLSAENGNGSIRATDSTLNLERIKNGNGGVEIAGQLQQTSDGSVELGNGSFKLRVGQLGTTRFDITTGNGSINFNQSNNFQSRSNHHLVTSGTGPLIRVNAGNGSVTIE